MTRRRLEYFITLAETLSFTKAAREHFVVQTTMSRQIAILEEEVGFELFERNTTKVILTTAGQAYLEDVKSILKAYDMAVTRAGLIAVKKAGIIRVGHAADLSQRCLAQVLEKFQQLNKEVEIKVSQASPDELIKRLQDGSIDVAAVYEQEVPEEGSLESMRFFESDILIGVARDHFLAKRKSVDSIELCQETICVAKKSSAPNLYRYAISCCRKDGYEPNVIEVDSFETQKLLARLGKGIGFFPDTKYLTTNETELSFVKLTNTNHKYLIDFAWNTENKNPSVIKFLEVAESISVSL